MSLESIRTRMQVLRESMSQILFLIHGLSKVKPDGVSPVETKHSAAGSLDSVSVIGAGDVSEEIRDNLRAFEEELDLIRQCIEDAQEFSSIPKSVLDPDALSNTKAIHSRLNDEVILIRTAFRKAQLKATLNKETLSRQEQLAYLAGLRSGAVNDTTTPTDYYLGKQKIDGYSQSEMKSSLFANRRNATRQNRAQTQGDLLLTQSSDFTSSLRRTHELLTSEVSRSRFAQDTLETSNIALKELEQHYGTLENLLSRSRKLLGTLLRSQKSDTWYLETAVWILIGTVCWLIFRRWLYGPLWWLIYMPAKVIWLVLAGFLFSSKGSFQPINSQTSEYTMQWLSNQPPGVEYTNAGRQSFIYDPTLQIDSFDETRIEVTRSSTQAFTDVPGAIDSIILPQPTLSQSQNLGNVNDDQQGAEQENSQVARDREGNQPEGDPQVVRGDGHVLRNRDQTREPTNKKKRIMEEPSTKQLDSRQRREEL